MTIQVPYLSDQEIEVEANMLLRSFESKYGSIETAATPLDEIIENHLGLAFEFSDLGNPAILGQLDVQENLIRINNVLDPYVNPRREGRYNYTLAHEGGHNVLHRPIVEELMNNTFLFEQEKTQQPIILCRMEDQKAPIEIQADKFASFLLLPKEKVIEEFLEYANRPFIQRKPVIAALRRDRDFLSQCFHPVHIPTDDEILNYSFKELADKFKVSMQAMIIRLKVLGLIREDEQEEFSYR